MRRTGSPRPRLKLGGDPERSPLPDVHFYVPSNDLLAALPQSAAHYWPWAHSAIQRAPAPLGNGQGDCTWAGPYNWTLQTYLYLCQAGFPCDVTARLPADGVTVAHGDFLPTDFRPGPRQFLVEIKPDRPLQCLYSNFVIAQNRRDPVRRGLQRWLVSSASVDLWPQPGLIPRDVGRGERFENACYMGNSEQFLPDVSRLAAEVDRLGMTWQMMPRERWHDYREVDVIVAVRPAAPGNLQHTPWAAYFAPEQKPATKLYNAWLAGVPAVLSPDIAFRDIRRSTLDFLEADSIPEIARKLRQLKQDPALRRAMVENGNRRAAEFAAERTTQRWVEILERRILPRYAVWRHSSWYRRWHFLSRRLLSSRFGGLG
jgi:hypothetical protein